MAEILLATLNAKWLHASFGLRCLRANLGTLRERSAILEFEISQRPGDIAEAILAANARVVGLGVYVWNATQTLAVVRVLKAIAPELVIVLGGPEISHETAQQELAQRADFVIRGEADLAFKELCTLLLAGKTPSSRWMDAPLPHFEQLADPYDEYTDADLQHRVVYVEASRGCPFTCEFCLSSLDVPVRRADLQQFLSAMARLHARGLRHFKFVDRTFNLGIDFATAILRFFHERLTADLFLHFELIPDRLPSQLRDEIAKFPPGALQFEVGVQSLDDATCERISRRQDRQKLQENLQWLAAHSGAHVHADLIVGLPGEDEATFAAGFDALWSYGPDEIQVGILKRLRGTPIVRHDAACGMQYTADAPYEVLATHAVPFGSMQRMKRFARYWDVVANSGNWLETLRLLLQPAPYAAFAAFANWLHDAARTTSGIALPRLAGFLWRYLTQVQDLPAATVGAAMAADYARCARHDWPEFLRPYVAQPNGPRITRSGAARQARHQRT